MLKRSNANFLSLIWWRTDRLLLGLIALISVVGLSLLSVASPVVAKKIGFNDFYFVKKQMIHMLLGIITMLGIVVLNKKGRINLINIGMVISCLLLLSTLFVGSNYKGAKRWISIFNFSIQPAEFVKVFMVSFCALHLSKWHYCIKYHDIREKINNYYPGHIISILMTGVVVTILLMQPNVSVVFIILVSVASLFFFCGINWRICFILVFGVILIIMISYFLLPHAKLRIDNFLFKSFVNDFGSNYQICKALQAITKGGIWGVGLGEGLIKSYLPDCHCDFIMAVALEEMGFVFFVLFIALYTIIIYRCIKIAALQSDIFEGILVAGLTSQFALQLLINIATNIRLVPITGITLPFVSYGGSSLLSSYILMGLIISCSKTHK